MIVLNVYGKINTRIISSKLSVGISNLPENWVSGLCDEMKEEMLLRDHNLAVWKRVGIKTSGINQYNLEEIVNRAQWNTETDNTENDYLKVISENLICIRVLDFDTSLLKLKNDTLDSPSCEKEYVTRFLRFCNMIQNNRSARSLLHYQIPFATYESDDIQTKPLVLNYLSAMIENETNISEYTNKCIDTMVKVGELIDNFLECDEDFWLLDYIINTAFFDHEYNSYHVFKVMSLIEMLIINPNKNGHTSGELENKLPKFMSNSIRIDESHRADYACLMRKLRNKIAHGDFKAVQKLLEQYRNEFMKNFYYDEFEHSIENWTYISICCELDEILSEVLWKLISDKRGLKDFQRS